MTTTDLEPAAWRKFENWFFRECVFGARRHLYAMFGMPLDEIRTHGDERHVLRNIRRQMQGNRTADQLQALIEERDRLRERVIGEAHSAKMLEIALRAICEPVGGTLPDAEVCRCIALSAIADQANRRAALAGEKP